MTRKIDKRACRKFAMPELEFNLNEGILHVESCPYIIRTAVRNISGQRILVLYIYQRENILAGSIKPRWVMFHSRDDFATLSLRENASATWQCSVLDSLDRIYRFDTKCAFYRQQDEARAAHFCKCEHSAISALICLQWSISRRKALERKWKKQRAIIERMKYVPVLPRDLKGFIHREVMPQYIFYDYQRKAPGHAYCTACRHEVRIAAAKHNTSGLCPRCKKKITFKCRGRRGRIFDRETVQVLQKAKNGEMLLRIVKAYRTFTDADTPVYFSVYENARHFISLCSDGHCSTSPYYLASVYKDDLTPWKSGYRPHFLSWRDSFEGETAGHLFLTACDCGVGLYAGEIINGLRTTDRDLMLICYIPHEEQATKWAPYLRERYFTMLEKCTLISAVCEVGVPDAQLQAYKKIIGLADVVLMVYDRDTPPTGSAEDSALAYAVDTAHKSVLMLDPIKLTTFQIDEYFRPQ